MKDDTTRTPCINRTAPHNPVADYTPAERAALDAPSVEDHLIAIRSALALNALVDEAIAQAGPLSLMWEIQGDAFAALEDVSATAWKMARELSEGLPAEVQTLSVVTDDGGEE